MKKILLTNFSIVQFAGSEINCATIAKRLKELGYEIYMGALEFSAPLYDIVKDNFDHTIHLLENDFDFSQVEFDLVWAHHSFLLDWLIFEKGLRAKKIITSSLSPKEPFESAPIYANKLCFSLANSPETMQQLQEKELVERVHLLENYSFLSYFEREIHVQELHKIAVVSNHVPPEVMESTTKLKEKGYEVDIYGFAGKQVLITDKILENYDCIITIGKTVQYAMSLKIPVYIYDIHGGDGYLTMQNMEQNRSHNFSGRGFNKKDSDTIVTEIIENFAGILPQLEEIKQYAMSNFCFEKKIDEVLERVKQSDEVNLEKIRQEYEYCRRNILVSKRLAEHFNRRNTEILKEKTIEFYQIKEQELQEKQREIENRGYLMNEKDEKIKELSSQNVELENEKQQLSNELNSIKNSKIWKLVEFFRGKN